MPWILWSIFRKNLHISLIWCIMLYIILRQEASSRPPLTNRPRPTTQDPNSAISSKTSPNRTSSKKDGFLSSIPDLEQSREGMYEGWNVKTSNFIRFFFFACQERLCVCMPHVSTHYFMGSSSLVYCYLSPVCYLKKHMSQASNTLDV